MMQDDFYSSNAATQARLNYHMQLPPDKVRALIAKRLKEAQIPNSMKSARFEALDTTQDQQAHATCRQFAMEGHYKGKRGLLLMGQPGCGKTTLGIAIVRQVVESSNGFWCIRFWNVPRGLDQIRMSFGNNQQAPDSTYEISCNRAVVLDDFGLGKVTDWVGQQFYNLIDGLYSQERQVVITTNIADADLHRLDDALKSRIIGMCHIVRMKGDDRRIA